ncbi:hypothetical protein [Azospirillum sp. TSO5]|uniref:hypothetical protein n=1 Tax=Azospirillum sp. TSO5 TaxID=716760 RepID=UPI000D613C18|nr:hypothetical protein [Azospirillum sp. TSO5]PWC98049.1 hypothetical protein TSO5_03340 [Azospirillum sp. TSO5]
MKNRAGLAACLFAASMCRVVMDDGSIVNVVEIPSPPQPTDDDLAAIARADLKRFRRAQKRLRVAARAGDVVGITLS